MNDPFDILKFEASAQGSFIKYIRKIFRKTYISYVRTCPCQGVINVDFAENLAYVLNEWSHITMIIPIQLENFWLFFAEENLIPSIVWSFWHCK